MPSSGTVQTKSAELGPPTPNLTCRLLSHGRACSIAQGAELEALDPEGAPREVRRQGHIIGGNILGTLIDPVIQMHLVGSWSEVLTPFTHPAAQQLPIGTPGFKLNLVG
jgi:hypothetical protein